MKAKLQAASELRDSIDLFTHTVPAEYTKFLQKLMPVFLDILKGPPVFISTSPEQVSKLRRWDGRIGKAVMCVAQTELTRAPRSE